MLQDMPDRQRQDVMRKHGIRWAASVSVHEAHSLWSRSNPNGVPSLQTYHGKTLRGMQGVSNAYRQHYVIEGLEYVQRRVGDKEKAIRIMQEVSETTDGDGFRVFRSYLEFAKACVIFGQREAGRHWDEKSLSQDGLAIHKRTRHDHLKTFLRSELVKRGLCGDNDLVM